MKLIIISALGLSILAAITFQNAASSPADEDEPGSNSTGMPANAFALVELFTSEGCSSCPPADAHLGDIVKKARRDNKPIYALSFHVDYWDYIGWKDPYARKAFSERQRDYAQTFRSNRIYTPQMVVNGKHEFVGSSRSKARKYIAEALEQPGAVSIILKREKSSRPRSLAVNYELSGVPEKAVLHVALVERSIVKEIRRGENSGRTLRHENVVRVFETVKLEENMRGRILMEAPKEVKLENSSIVAYIQRDSDMAVLAATGMDL